MRVIVITLILGIAGLVSCQTQEREIIDGLSYVAPPKKVNISAMHSIRSIGTDYIAVIPYAFQSDSRPEVQYGFKNQWWGETISGVKTTIEQAHDSGLSVMLKPQVYLHNSWPGAVDYETEQQWQIWEESYGQYIMTMAAIAAEYNIDLFCIGTEYDISVGKRTAFWRSLIKDIRSIYSGKLTYSANWTDYEDLSIWDELDFIGISAYFPLTDENNPGLNKLIKCWSPEVVKMKSVSEKYNKQVLFTEYGYLSVDNTAYKNWELEKNLRNRNINESAQANAIEALHSVFRNEEFWAGGFLWKWYPDMKGHEGNPERDYSPQGKKAMNVITRIFTN